MFTKDSYAQGLCTSQEYYSQFVTQDVIDVVRAWMRTSPKTSNAGQALINRGALGAWLPVAKALETETLKARIGAAGDSINPVVLVCVARAAARLLHRARVDNSELCLSSFIADREWGW